MWSGCVFDTESGVGSRQKDQRQTKNEIQAEVSHPKVNPNDWEI